MVQAILAGKKTQTRRVIKPRYDNSVFEFYKDIFCEAEPPTPSVKLPNGMMRHKVRAFVPCKQRYAVGDILWVRETWSPNIFSPAARHIPENTKFVYKADAYRGNPFYDYVTQWKPSIHMPKAAARLFLRVTRVRVERIRDIVPNDVMAEGGFYNLSQFKDLWNIINAKGGFGWEDNPWVWVYEFERVEMP